MALLKKNIIDIRLQLNDGVKLMMVAKANAYGAGFRVAVSVEDMVDCYGVARATEGIALRTLGVTKPILLLSYRDDECNKALDYNLTPCVSSVDGLKKLSCCGVKSCHIAVDTGMNRLGVKSISEFRCMLSQDSGVNIEGIYSHIYHNSASSIAAQKYKFSKFMCAARAILPNISCHIASTGSYKYLAMQCDMVRVGIGIYHDTMRIVSSVLCVKNLRRGEEVSYNGEFVATHNMRIAVVEGGYADGIDKRFNRFCVTIGGQRCKVLGAICMDTFVVDITGIACEVGDEVSIIGAGDIDNIALMTGVSEYEWLTALKGRYEYGIDG